MKWITVSSVVVISSAAQAWAGSTVRVHHGPFDPLVDVPSVEVALTAGSSTELYVVQIATRPVTGAVDGIAAAGGTVHQCIPDDSYIVRITPSLVPQITALPDVRWVGKYHPAYRVEPFILAKLNAGNEDLSPSLRYNILVFTEGQKQIVADRIATIGGVVDNPSASMRLLEATLTPEQLLGVVQWDEVHFIDRWFPWMEFMDVARVASGANYIETVAGYTGAGVVGEVIDSGFNLHHIDFKTQGQGNPRISWHPGVATAGSCPTTNSHGTSTSGIIFGDGWGNVQGKGLLPLATGYISSKPNDRDVHTGELLNLGVVFQSSSVGYIDDSDPPPLELIPGPDYTNMSYSMDDDLFKWDVLHVQAFGNSGCNVETRRAVQIAWAKNILAVGSIHHDNNPNQSSHVWCTSAECAESLCGSYGPAADGRIKPDLAHFIDSILTVDCPGDSYRSDFGGTSAAAPITAGLAGLFFEMWHDGIFGNPTGMTVFESRPHMATAKAMLINTASQWTFSGAEHDLTRVHQGWGMAHVGQMYDRRNMIFAIDETDVLTEGQSTTYYINLADGSSPLRATLVYTDPPGSPAVQSQHRVNDLDLKVTSPGGSVYWGNYGLCGEQNPSLCEMWSAPGGSPNDKDTVENVFVQTPSPGLWTVEIIAAEVNMDGHPETPGQPWDVDYALVVSAPFDDCNNNGIGDGQDIYAAGASGDCNENGRPDECDIADEIEADCNSDGVPDSCPGCTSNCECIDDDVCTFDSCVAGVCTHNTALHMDVTSYGGTCGPDGVVDLVDIQETADAFEGQPLPAGCAPLQFDLTRSAGGLCGTDGYIRLQELLAVQNAFIGSPFCCAGGSAPSCPPDAEDPIIIFDPVALRATPTGPVVAYFVDVHAYGFKSLRGYQVNVVITGLQASFAQISDISVDEAKPTYVFAGTPSDDRDQAIDLAGLRMMGALRSGGVKVRSYLATLRLDRAVGAPENFTVTLATTTETQVFDPNGCPETPAIVVEDFEF